MKQRITIPTAADFEEVVREYAERHELSECLYRNVVKEFSEIKDLSQLTINHTRRILEPFLLTWGQMSRVLGRQGCDAIRKKIVELNTNLNRYRGLNLSTIDSNKEKDEINRIFQDISSLKSKTRSVGPTATSKILHLISPDLFPMWDSKIRVKWGYRGDAQEYFEFTVQLQNWVNSSNLRNTLEKLKNEYQKSYVKLIDQYNWYTAWNR